MSVEIPVFMEATKRRNNILLLILNTGFAMAAWPQAEQHHGARIWELGTYPVGTWAALDDINDLGVAAGLGDVPPIGFEGVGYTYSLAVPLLGPNASKWIDLDPLGGKQSKGREEPLIEVSNAGLIASHSTARDGQVHAVAWTNDSGMVDLGTLTDMGNSKYRSPNSRFACTTNRLGTLIAGSGGVDGAHDVPVVWASAKVWKDGGSVTSGGRC